jgi:1,6-anhydro-N-acetylmuramate kinase
MPRNVAPTSIDDPEVSTIDQKQTPEQLKKAAERKARVDKKVEEKKVKRIEKDRRATELDLKRELKERKAEDRRLEKEIQKAATMKDDEDDAQRLAEEAKLLAEELMGAGDKDQVTKHQPHTKKSFAESNRLGGSHMA